MSTGEWVAVGIVGALLVGGTGVGLYFLLRTPPAPAPAPAPAQVGTPFGAPETLQSSTSRGRRSRRGGDILSEEAGAALGGAIGTGVGGPAGTAIGTLAGGILGKIL